MKITAANLAVEMTGRGKRGKPTTGFPLFSPPLEIAMRFPHSHSLYDGPVLYKLKSTERTPVRSAPLQAHPSMRKCSAIPIEQRFRNLAEIDVGVEWKGWIGFGV
jgi:hypothetical protein